jgi:hypothetical protein
MALGGLFSLVNCKGEDFKTHHMEGFESCTTQFACDKDVFGGGFRQYGDSIPYLAFQFQCPSKTPPHGFPYNCIKNIHIEANGFPLLQYSGKQLWCMFQIYPDEQRKSIELAARRGVVVLKDIVPVLHIIATQFTRLTWKLEVDQSRYEVALKTYRSTTEKWIADLALDGIQDLAHLCCLYASLERGYFNYYTPYVFINPEFRSDMFNVKGTLYPMCYYQEWEASQQSVRIACKYRKVIQFHFLVERPDDPYVFYAPEDAPLDEIIISCQGIQIVRGSGDELSLVDKLVHTIPISTHVAHYTYTLQTFDEHKKQQGHIQDFNNMPVHGCLTMNMKDMDDVTVNIKLSPHIDPRAKICMWILGVGALRYSMGTVSSV